jgi:hypothetical protein
MADQLPNEPMPTWVKISGIVAIAAVVLFIIVHLAGGGFRGHMMESHGAPAESAK